MNSTIVIIAVVILGLAIVAQMLSLTETFANAPATSCGRQGDGPCPNGTKCVAGFCGEAESQTPAADQEDDLDNPYSAY
jgi:hypothetical protein